MSQRRNHNKRHSQSKKRNKRSIGKKVLIILGSVLLFLVLAVGAVGAYWVSSSPELSEKDLTGTIASTIYDASGNSVYETSSNERIIIDEDSISQQAFDAVTSIEDRRFMSHNGFDLRRILGSALANLKAGSISQGGSTLTQQLVKLSVFSTKEEDQTYKRKVQEIWLAMQLEKDLSKQEIFEYYINKVYMANGVYGMGTAANIYYGKDLKDLSLNEVALLAGMPQAPNSYDPYHNPEEAKKRRDNVLAAMLENEKITQEEYDEAVATPIDEGLQSIEEIQQEENANDLMLDSYVQEVADEIEAEGYDIYTDGLEIHTYLDTAAQSHVYETLKDDDGQYFPDDRMQSAASVLDTDTGNIVALVGGRQYEDMLSLNRATTLERSIGSSIKPFSAYGPSIEYMNYSTDSSIVDEEHKYNNGMEIYNWDRQYQGMLTLRQALVGSRNVPALKLIQELEKEVGFDKVNEFLQNVGITVNNGEGVYESNALGGEATPLQLSAAYATLGNYGEYNEPKAVEYFINTDGTRVDVSGESRQAMADSTAYMLTDMLKGSFTDTSHGLLTNYHTSGLYEAGKSGTTNYTEDQMNQLGLPDEAVPDVWASGYTKNYAVSIWTGYDNPTDTSEKNYLVDNDRQIANNLYANIMGYLSTNVENTDWEQPSSVHEVPLEFGAVPTKFATNSTASSRRITGLANDALYDDYVNNRQKTTTQSTSSSQSSQAQETTIIETYIIEDSEEATISSEETPTSEIEEESTVEEATETEETVPDQQEGTTSSSQTSPSGGGTTETPTEVPTTENDS